MQNDTRGFVTMNRVGSRSGGLRCSFTGYRPKKMGFIPAPGNLYYDNIRQRLMDTIDMLIQQGYGHFLSGGARGFDTWAAETVLDAKKRYSAIMLEMVAPFSAQSAKWNDADREMHATLFQAADVVTVICQEYTKSCMFRRNRYLVDNADVLLACYDGKPGGTAMTVDMAKRDGVRTLFIPPIQTIPIQNSVPRFLAVNPA